ncbi:unnamed protein product [Adineta ricciae]|uniref:Uncharacterized protein n=1 Tax=Adineta ricciae TaxID=249248 RepID=A0A814BL18_ADIRI|nr:unnamed protein product [Adineta ricciae]
MEALAGAGLVPLPSKPMMRSKFYIPPVAQPQDLYPVLDEVANEAKEEEKRTDDALVKLTPYPTLVELQSIIEEQKPDSALVIQPPSIEPLKDFIEKRAATIEGLRDLRARMAKHVLNCKISNTVVGVPVLLAGSATSLGTAITESVIEKRLRTKYVTLLKDDSLAMQICESNLKDITAWLVTVYSLGYSVSKAGVNFLQLAEAIQAAATLGSWAELVGQLPSLAGALATGAKTAGTISGKILGVSVIISVADLIHTWISKSATLKSIDKDIELLEQQLKELKRIVEAYHP